MATRMLWDSRQTQWMRPTTQGMLSSSILREIRDPLFDESPRRCSAACAYYTPFSDRPNFTVFLNATASRIIWKDSNNKLAQAAAVEYITNDGAILRAFVGKEVIVTAGTIGSPKFLELSGVGNATYVSLYSLLSSCHTKHTTEF